MATVKFDVSRAVKNIKKSAAAKKKAANARYSGGTLMDILDTLQIPQSVITAGLSERYSLGEGFTQRVTPSEVLGLKGGQGLIADIGLDPTWLLGAGAVGAGSKAAKAGTGAKTLGAAVKANESSLLKLGIPFTERAVSIPKMLGLGKVEDLAAEGLTRLGGTIKRAPFGKGNTLGQTLNKTFGVTEGFKKGLSLEDIEKSVSAQIEAAKIAKAPLVAGRVASNQALHDIEPIIRKVSKEDEALMSKWMYDYKKNPTIPKGLSKAGQKIAKLEVMPLLDNALEQARLLGADVLKNKTLTNVPVKGGEKISGVGAGMKVLQRETKPEKFANVFKVGNNIYQGSKTKAVNIANPKDVLIKRANRWVDSKRVDEITELELEHKALSSSVDKWRKQLDSASLADIGLADGAAPKSQTLKRWINEGVERMAAITENINNISGGGLRQAAMPSEVNALRASLGLPPMFKESGFEGLHSTLSELGAYRARVQAIDKIKNSPIVVDAKGMTDSQLAAEGLEKIKIKGLEKYAATPEVRRALEHTVHGYSSLGPLEGAVRNWHYATNMFKKMSTYWWPAFHARNAISNLWQITLAGVKNPVDAFRGYRSLWTIGKLQKKGLRGERLQKAIYKTLGKQEAKYHKEFIEHGLGGTGRYFGDLDEALVKRNALDRAGGAVGNYLEDSSKFSLYMQRRKAGFLPDAAASEVRKYLFDYSDLTDFERIALKGVMPFYTWTRNNLPLQLAMLIQKPGKVNILGHVKRAIESMQEGEPMDETLLPEWMREGFNIYMGDNPEGIQKFLRLEGFLPTIDLNYIGKPGEKTVGQLNPLIKTPLEIFTNYDFFFKRQLQEYAGQTVPVAGVEVPPWVGKIAKTLRPVNELARASGLDGEELTKVDRAMRFMFGINIKGFDPKKQNEVFDMLVGRNTGKLKSELKKALKEGNGGKVEDLMELLLMVEENTKL